MSKLENTRVLRRALLPATCAALLGGCAPYEPMHPVYGTTAPVLDTPVTLFDRWDSNRDGFLSRAEVEPLGVRSQAVTAESATATFHRLDTNGDGFLSRAEAQSTLAAIPGASFDASDADRNGFLSLSEAMPHLRWIEGRGAAGTLSFETYDTNRDGLLSRVEAEPLMSSAQMVDGRYVVAPPFSFDRLDANRDGFLSRAEAAPIAGPVTFDRHDGNRDGFLSRAESDSLFRSGVGGTAAGSGGVIYGPRY